jgi:uncharacterized membrane protein
MKIKDTVILTAIGSLILAAILAYCLVSYGRDQWDFHEWNNYIRFGEVRHYRVSGLKCFLMSFVYFIFPTSVIPLLVYNSKVNG